MTPGPPGKAPSPPEKAHVHHGQLKLLVHWRNLQVNRQTPPGQQAKPPGPPAKPQGQQAKPPGQQAKPPGQQVKPPGPQAKPPGPPGPPSKLFKKR